jgi:hypothetical protein
MYKKIILMILVLGLASMAYAGPPLEPNSLWVGGEGAWTVASNWADGNVPTNINGVIIDSSPDYNSLDMAINVTIGNGQNAVCGLLHGPGHEAPDTGGSSLTINGNGTLMISDGIEPKRWYPVWHQYPNSVCSVDIAGDAVVTNGLFRPGDMLYGDEWGGRHQETWLIERRIFNVNIRENATWNCGSIRDRRVQTIMTFSDNATYNGGNMRFCDQAVDTLHFKDNCVINCDGWIRGGDLKTDDNSCVFTVIVDGGTINSFNPGSNESGLKFGDSGSGHFFMNGGTFKSDGGVVFACKGDGGIYQNIWRQAGGLAEFGNGFSLCDSESAGGVQKCLVLGGESVFGLDEDGDMNFYAPRNPGAVEAYNQCYMSISGGIMNAGNLELVTDPNKLTIDVNDVHGGGMFVVGSDANSYNNLSDANIQSSVTDSNNAYRFKYMGQNNTFGVTYLGINTKNKAWGPWPSDRHQFTAQTVEIKWNVADIIDAADSQKLYVSTDAAIIDAIGAGGAGETALYGSGISSHTLTNLSPVLVNYWRVDSKKDGTWTKGDLWRFGIPQGKAAILYPADNTADGSKKVSDYDLTLRWVQSPWPAYLINQNVYYGTNATEVADANTSDVNAFVGTFGPDVNTLHIGSLDLGVTRWWRIDSNLNTATKDLVKGDVWRFTIADYYTIENFDWYGGTVNLRNTWLDYYADSTNGAAVAEMTEPNRYAKHSKLMDFDWITSGYTHWDTKRTFDSPIDMTVFDLKALVLYSYGDPCNTSGTPLYSLTGPQKVYVTLSDGPNTVTLPYDGDANDIFVNLWSEWNIALADFAPVDLTQVASIMLSVTDDETGNGHVKFDDIRLHKQRCVPHYSGVTEVDYNSDCIINYADTERMRSNWLKIGTDTDFHIVDPNTNCLDFALMAEKWQQGVEFPAP